MIMTFAGYSQRFQWCTINLLTLLMLLIPFLTTGQNNYYHLVLPSGNISHHGCTPTKLAPQQLAAWVTRINSTQPAPAPYNRQKRATTQQSNGVYGNGVVVSDSIGTAPSQCSRENLCYPTVTSPLVCYTNRQACDGVRNCVTERDELYCDDCLCPYQVVNGVLIAVPRAQVEGWANVNLKACARICNDVVAGCLGFAFSPLKNNRARCVTYLGISSKLVSKPGTDLYVRESPSQPRLAPPDDSVPQPQPVQTAPGRPDLNCSPLGKMRKCGQRCLPHRYVCDGIRQCDVANEETLCPALLSIWTKESGRTISSYSVPEPELSLGSCAAFCLADGQCDVFSYVSSSRECRVGCSSCGGQLDVYADDEADYYSPSVEAGTGTLVGLLDAFLARAPSSDKVSLKSKVNSFTSSLSERGFTFTSRPFTNLFPAPSSIFSQSIVSTTRSQAAFGSVIITPSRSSVFVISSTRPTFGGGNAANSPSFNRPNSGGSPSFNSPNSGGSSSQFGAFTTPAPAPTPPLVTSQQQPANCGRRPLTSLAATDQLTQSRVLQRSGTSNRLVAGHRASAGTYPWQAQIQAYNPSGFWEHHCGGVVITSRHVLTAAHCLTRTLTALQVVVGQHDRRDASEQHEQTFAIENAIAHPDYRTVSSSIYANDIAVLKLRLRQGRAVQFSTHVQPLCLPSATRAAPLPGARCEISGWGKTDALAPDTPSSAADVLHGGVVPLVSDSFCASTEVYGDRFLPERMVCAGSVRGGTDACQGDSGGPLACQRPDGTWEVIGIVSFGSGCGAELRPGVYTEVRFYVGWIQRVVQVI